MLFRATAKLGLMHQSPTAPPWVTEAIPLPRNTRPGCGANGPPTTAARRTVGADTTPGALAASAAARSCGAGLVAAEAAAAPAVTSIDPARRPPKRRDMTFPFWKGFRRRELDLLYGTTIVKATVSAKSKNPPTLSNE